MSPLAFDKQGKPFSWHTRTAKLRLRLFRTPSSRGTCSQVLDSAGNPQFVDASIDYPEFRRVVGHVPGLYRLDPDPEQADDDAQGPHPADGADDDEAARRAQADECHPRGLGRAEPRRLGENRRSGRQGDPANLPPRRTTGSVVPHAPPQLRTGTSANAVVQDQINRTARESWVVARRRTAAGGHPA